MQTTLALTAIGQDHPGVMNLFAKSAKTCHCTMLCTKASVFGDTFTLMTNFVGSWHGIAKLESVLLKLCQKNDFMIQTKRNQQQHTKFSGVPYYVQMIAPDRPNILFELTQFFSRKGIPLDEIQCDTFPAPKTGTLMANVGFQVYIPAKMHITTLRESFMVYSEELNLDVVMEPIK